MTITNCRRLVLSPSTIPDPTYGPTYGGFSTFNGLDLNVAPYTLRADGWSSNGENLEIKLLAAGDVAATVAAAARDVYLARYANPLGAVGDFTLARPGAVRTQHGILVDPIVLRAGDRMRVMDGPLAGNVLMLSGTRYANGAITCSPEQALGAAQLLAKV